MSNKRRFISNFCIFVVFVLYIFIPVFVFEICIITVILWCGILLGYFCYRNSINNKVGIFDFFINTVIITIYIIMSLTINFSFEVFFDTFSVYCSRNFILMFRNDLRNTKFFICCRNKLTVVILEIFITVSIFEVSLFTVTIYSCGNFSYFVSFNLRNAKFFICSRSEVCTIAVFIDNYKEKDTYLIC